MYFGGCDRQDFYAFGNLTIYDSPHQRKSEKFRGPDFFVVLNTERKPHDAQPISQSISQLANNRCNPARR